MGLSAASVSEGQKPRRRSRRGRTALLVLVALASAGTACTYAARVWPFSATGTCQQLVSTVRASEASYAPGQTVIISVTLANEGPACSTGPFPCPPPPPASAYNSAGEDVWDYGAVKGPTGIPTCMPDPPPQTWPAHYTSTQELDWSQDACRTGPLGQANPNCPGTQVPPGTYRIVASTGTSVSATITISG
jgi:hypothetical protein